MPGTNIRIRHYRKCVQSLYVSGSGEILYNRVLFGALIFEFVRIEEKWDKNSGEGTEQLEMFVVRVNICILDFYIVNG